MTFDPITISVAVMAVVILGLSKGGFAGVGMLSTPLLSLVLPPASAAAIILPILLLQDAVSLWSYRTNVQTTILRALVPGAIVGVLAGAALVGHINADYLSTILGMVSVVFGAERLWRLWAGSNVARQPSHLVGVACGVLAGLTSMIAHAGVPPFQFYVLPQRLPRDIYIGTSVAFFALVNWVKLPFFVSLGQFSRDGLVASALLVPIALLSVFLGIRLVRRISQTGFLITANVILIMIGMVLMLRGLS